MLDVAIAEQVYQYLAPSAVRSIGQQMEVVLATSGGNVEGAPASHPIFFDGFLEQPDLVAAIQEKGVEAAALGGTLARLYDGRGLGRGLVVAAARTYLSGLQGSGKAAALAKSLVGTVVLR